MEREGDPSDRPPASVRDDARDWQDARARPVPADRALARLPEHTAPPEATGVKLIAAYKMVKALVEVVLAIVLGVLVASGYVERAHDLAMAIKDHLVHHWAIRVAEAVLRNLTVRRIDWLIAAIVGDAFMSAFEGWALLRGYLWAPWLVVGATSLLLPVELHEVFHRVTAGRVLIFIVNLTIVVYLARNAWRAHKKHRIERRQPRPQPQG